MSVCASIVINMKLIHKMKIDNLINRFVWFDIEHMSTGRLEEKSIILDVVYSLLWSLAYHSLMGEDKKNGITPLEIEGGTFCFRHP